MKKVFIIFLFFCKIITAQELRFPTSTGYAFGKTNSLKKIMLYTDIGIGYEFQIKDDYFLCATIGGAALKFSYSDTGNINVFNKRYFVNIPLTLKRYFFINKKSWYFFEIGPVFDYCIMEKKELKNYFMEETKTQRGLGWELGVVFGLIFKKMITNTVSFEIGILSQQNYLQQYKNEDDKISYRTNSLRLSFYRSLAKQ